MANRTYLPTLRVLTYAIIKFVARYRVQIDRNLGEGQIALLNALIAAAQTLADSLGDPVVGP